MSSSRPTNGLTNAAPTLAASRAWAAEKIRVTLTRMPSSVSSRHACTPGFPNGTLTTTWGSMPASSRPSRTMPAASVATTSALTGPATTSQMRLRTARGSAPVPASSEGLVVTPSMMPSGTRASISPTFAVSTNSFMPSSEMMPAAGGRRLRPPAALRRVRPVISCPGAGEAGSARPPDHATDSGPHRRPRRRSRARPRLLSPPRPVSRRERPDPRGRPRGQDVARQQVITAVTNSTSCRSGKINSRVLECCRRSPLTRASMPRGRSRSAGAMQGPTGANVSNPLARCTARRGAGDRGRSRR